VALLSLVFLCSILKQAILPNLLGYRVLTDEDIIRVRKFAEKRKKDPKSRLGINEKGTDKRG